MAFPTRNNFTSLKETFSLENVQQGGQTPCEGEKFDSSGPGATLGQGEEFCLSDCSRDPLCCVGLVRQPD